MHAFVPWGQPHWPLKHSSPGSQGPHPEPVDEVVAPLEVDPALEELTLVEAEVDDVADALELVEPTDASVEEEGAPPADDAAAPPLDGES